MTTRNFRMDQVFQEDQGVKSRKIMKGFRPTAPVVFLIWLLLLFTLFPPSTAYDHDRSVFSSRKAKFFQTSLPRFHLVSSEPRIGFGAPGEGSLYDDDKRIIHTGPNPLHN